MPPRIVFLLSLLLKDLKLTTTTKKMLSYMALFLQISHKHFHIFVVSTNNLEIADRETVGPMTPAGASFKFSIMNTRK